MDATDQRILDLLRADGRMSIAALANAAHVSRATAYARLNALVDAGVIRGFTVDVDPVLAGAHSSAYIGLSIEQHSWQRVRERLSAIAEVEHIALLGGEFDVLILVRARDTKDLRRVALEELQSIPEVRSTRTFLVFEDFTPARRRVAAEH